jgi:hypothetical protein
MLAGNKTVSKYRFPDKGLNFRGVKFGEGLRVTAYRRHTSSH